MGICYVLSEYSKGCGGQRKDGNNSAPGNAEKAPNGRDVIGQIRRKKPTIWILLCQFKGVFLLQSWISFSQRHANSRSF